MHCDDCGRQTFGIVKFETHKHVVLLMLSDDLQK